MKMHRKRYRFILPVAMTALTALILASTARAGNLLSRPAGFIRIEVDAGAQPLLALPFDPFSSALDDIFAGQLQADEEHGAFTTVIRKLDPLAQIYETAYRITGSDNPAVDDIWFSNLESPEVSDMIIEGGEGFFIENQDVIPHTVTLAGWLILDAESEHPLFPGLNLFGYPYPVNIGIDETHLAATGTEGDIITEEGSPRIQHTLADGQWRSDPESGASSDLEFTPGGGYWYQSQADDIVLWRESRPFDSVFPNDSEPPFISGITIDANARANIHILAEPNARLDVFARNLPWDDETDGWQHIAADVKTGIEGQAWVIDKNPGPARVYVLACAVTDTHGDGTTDAMALLGYEPAVIEPTASDPAPIIVLLNEGGSPPDAYYVDTGGDDDENDGSEGSPFATIGKAIAAHGETPVYTFYVSAGDYPEGRVVVPEGVRFKVVDGRVRIMPL